MGIYLSVNSHLGSARAGKMQLGVYKMLISKGLKDSDQGCSILFSTSTVAARTLNAACGDRLISQSIGGDDPS